MKAGNSRLVVAATLALGLSVWAIRGQDPVTNPTPAAAAPAAADGGESTTETNAVTNAIAMAQPRDPFWPVGYQEPDPRKLLQEIVKKEEIKKEEIKKTIEISWPTLEVTAVFKTPQGKWMATIRGIGMVEEGDLIRVRKGEAWYRWKIRGINEKGIRYDRLDVVPIQPRN